ncbi:MAG: polyhydroxyalkanoate synthesis repressor PhaR [Hyphomicrobiaceae bacterium]|nr:polyhydroxyalkanoate synthesis repressor PhaR [Hyphomicrobiaceae bacterium]
MLHKTEVQQDKQQQSVVIKKYANRRLYNTETSTYVTLDDLATMVRSDRDFVVFDAKTGDDLTHSVLTQIIVDQESKGQTMLPIPFLRQLIRFYDDSIARMVPGYLQFSLEALAQEQEKFRNQFASAFGSPTAAFEVYQEQARRNIAIFEQAMHIWSPFAKAKAAEEAAAEAAAGLTTEAGATTPATATKPVAAPPASRDELSELKAQLAAMQQKIERLAGSSD